MQQKVTRDKFEIDSDSPLASRLKIILKSSQ